MNEADLYNVMTETEKSSSEKNLVPRTLRFENPGDCDELAVPSALRRAVLQDLSQIPSLQL